MISSTVVSPSISDSTTVLISLLFPCLDNVPFSWNTAFKPQFGPSAPWLCHSSFVCSPFLQQSEASCEVPLRDSTCPWQNSLLIAFRLLEFLNSTYICKCGVSFSSPTSSPITMQLCFFSNNSWIQSFSQLLTVMQACRIFDIVFWGVNSLKTKKVAPRTTRPTNIYFMFRVQ